MPLIRHLIGKLKIPMYVLIVLLSCLFLASCHQLKLIDVSSDPSYSHVIGKKIRLKEDVLALGISSNTPPRPPADYIDLVERPGYRGRYVIDRSELKKGTLLQVVGVNAHIFLGFKINPEYIVKEIGSNHLKGALTRTTIVGKSNDETYGLNGKVFERVENP